MENGTSLIIHKNNVIEFVPTNKYTEYGKRQVEQPTERVEPQVRNSHQYRCRQTNHLAV